LKKFLTFFLVLAITASCGISATAARPVSSLITNEVVTPSYIEIDVDITNDVPRQATMIAGAYDGSARLVGIALKVVTLPAGTSSQYITALLAPQSDARTVKVFLLDPDAQPIAASAEASVLLTQSAPTGLTGVAPTTYNGSDGTINGAAVGMEYAPAGTAPPATYTPVTGSSITGLVPGWYYVRYAAKPGYGAGAVVSVEVPNRTLGYVPSSTCMIRFLGPVMVYDYTVYVHGAATTVTAYAQVFGTPGLYSYLTDDSDRVMTDSVSAVPQVAEVGSITAVEASRLVYETGGVSTPLATDSNTDFYQITLFGIMETPIPVSIPGSTTATLLYYTMNSAGTAADEVYYAVS
jgi:hypothetical protein